MTTKGKKSPQSDKGADHASGRPRADWEAIGKDYRGTNLSVRAIGRKHGVSEKAIRKKAEELGWTRNLADEIRSATQSALVRIASGEDDQAAIEAAVSSNVELIRDHQKRIKRALDINDALLAELQMDTLKIDEIQALIDELCEGDVNPQRRNMLMRAVSLGNRSNSMVSLGNSLKTLVTLERQAHGIDANPEPPKDDMADLLAAIDGKTAGLPCKQEMLV